MPPQTKLITAKKQLHRRRGRKYVRKLCFTEFQRRKHRRKLRCAGTQRRKHKTSDASTTPIELCCPILPSSPYELRVHVASSVTKVQHCPRRTLRVATRNNSPCGRSSLPQSCVLGVDARNIASLSSFAASKNISRKSRSITSVPAFPPPQ